MAITSFWELFQLRTEMAVQQAAASQGCLTAWGHFGTQKGYDEALPIHLKFMKKKVKPRKRKILNSEEHGDNKLVGKKPKRLQLPESEKQSQPHKGMSIECAMNEESAEGGIEWVPGKVSSVSLYKKTITVRVTVGQDSWNEKYKFKEEGEEWRRKMPSTESGENHKPAESSSSTHGALTSASDLQDVLQSECKTSDCENNKVTLSAEMSTPEVSEVRLASDSGAQRKASSDLQRELKVGVTVECACEDNGGVEWHCGTGNDALLSHCFECSAVLFLLCLFCCFCSENYHCKFTGMITPSHVAVLAVHAKSQKFKVCIEVDTPQEKGKWNETFQVLESFAESCCASGI